METGINRIDIETAHLAEEVGVRMREIDIRTVFDSFVQSTNDQIKKTEEALADLRDTIDDAFADGIISAAEAAAIERSKTNLKIQKSELDAKFIIIYSNSYLGLEEKVELNRTKNEFDFAHNSLMTTIDDAIADGYITTEEKARVDAAFDRYENVLANLTVAIEQALKSIQQNMIDAIEIGGRNLLLSSGSIQTKRKGDTEYQFGGYETSRILTPGKLYTYVWQAISDAPTGVRALATDQLIDTIRSKALITQTKVFRADKATSFISLVHAPNGSYDTSSTVYWAMLFEGDVKAPKDWFPAPEDIEALVADMSNELKQYTDSVSKALKVKMELGDKALHDELTLKEAQLILKTENDKRELEKKLNDKSEALTTSIDDLKDNFSKETEETKKALDDLSVAINDLPTNTQLTNLQLENLRYLSSTVEMEYMDVNFKINVVMRDNFLPPTQKPILEELQRENRIRYNDLKKALDDALADEMLTEEEIIEINKKLNLFKDYLDVTNRTILDTYNMIAEGQDDYFKNKIEGSIESTRLYVEYSVDGSRDWHEGFVTGDIYMRQKNGKGGNWSDPIKIVGENGAGGIYEDFQFAKNKSLTNPPTNGWIDAPPAVGADEFLWMRTGQVIPPATEPTYWTAVRISGPQGPKGEDGSKGQDGLQGLQGKDGRDGIPGAKGEDGQTSYTHVAYADTATGGGMSQSSVGKAYMGMYVDFTAKDSDDPTKYQWTLIKGMDGANGVPGKPGSDGKTPYFHIAYANSADGSIGFSTTDSKNKSYIGTYTDFIERDSENHVAYTWQKVRGESIVSSTEPADKYVGMVWIDTSKKPIEQKYWDGSTWILTGLSNTDVANAIKKANDELQSTMENALEDGLISNNESITIANQANILDNNKKLLDTQFTVIYNDKNLSDISKKDLQTKKTDFDAKHKSLYDYCIAISKKTSVTEAEKIEYNKRQQAYNDSLIKYSKALEDCAQEILQNSIEGIEIGGRNYIKGSNEEVSSDIYRIKYYPIYNYKSFKNGDNVICTIWGKLGTDRKNFSIHNSGGTILLADLKLVSPGIYTATFKWRELGTVTPVIPETLFVYQMLNNNTSVSSIEKIKLEKGTKRTDWSVAPEDIDEQMQHIINNAAQAEVINSEARAKINFLGKPTTSENGLITGGALLVGDSVGNNAFISGVTDKGDKSVRFGAGNGGYAKKETVPFRVLNDGTLYASKAIISGQITILPGSPALDLIDQKVKKGVESIEVGARNYAIDSFNIYANKNNVYTQNKLNPKELKANDPITVSVDIDLVNGSIGSSQGRIGAEFAYKFRTQKNGEIFTGYIGAWYYLSEMKNPNFKGRLSTTQRIHKNAIEVTEVGVLYLYGALIISDVSTVSMAKIEKGTIATDWSPAPEDVVDSEIFIEYSSNGVNTWHTGMVSTDKFMRQKKGPNGTWGQAVRIAGIDGTNGTNGPKGDKGDKGDQGLSGPKGTDGKDGTNGDNGTPGKDGKYSIYQFAKSTSLTSAPSSGWTAVPPALAVSEYLWQRIGDVIPPATQPTTWQTAVRISGPAGSNGKDGDKGATGPAGKDGANGVQGLQGAKGDQGIAGVKGNDGRTSYTHIAYADTATGGGFSQVPTGKAYIGMYVDFVATDSTNVASYKWSLIKGEDGKNGIAGPTGADGKTPYFHTAWATNATGTAGFSTTISTDKTHIGTYTDFVQLDSTDPKKYSWSQIKGDKGNTGDKGATGPAGTNGSNGKDGKYTLLQYAKNTSTTVAPTTGFTENPPTLGSNEFLWMRKGEVTPPATVPSAWTTPVRISGLHGADGQKGDRGPQGVEGPVGEPLGDGVMIFTDPDFRDGRNGAMIYAGSTEATFTRIAKSSDAPTQSVFMLRIINNGTAEESRRGGFVQNTQSRANAVFVHKIVAKIPIGHTIMEYSNATGSGRTVKWLTSQEGSGKFETYMYKHTCGVGGSFSTFGHVGFLGPAGTAAAPINYDIAYSTIFDMSIPDRRLDFLTTTIGTDSVATGTLLVGQGQAATAGVTGVRTSGASSNVAFWAGLGYENREQAPFQVWTDGRLKATDADISGKITATSGSFTGAVTATSGSFTGTINANAGTFNNVTANNLTVNSGTFTGGIKANSGYFGALEIKPNGLKYDEWSAVAAGYEDYYGIAMSFKNQSSVHIGKGKFMFEYDPVNTMGEFFSNNSNKDQKNVAIAVGALGGKTNHAMLITRGDIAGMSLYTVIPTYTNYTVTNESQIISGNMNLSLKLPTEGDSNLWEGRTIKIKKHWDPHITITTGGPAIVAHSGFSLGSTYIMKGKGEILNITYMNGLWYVMGTTAW